MRRPVLQSFTFACVLSIALGAEPASGRGSAEPDVRFGEPLPEFSTRDATTVYEAPSPDSRILMRLPRKARVAVAEVKDGWARVRSRRNRPDGFVRRSALRPLTVRYERWGVREVQRGLAERGYDPGPVDGAFGSATMRAVRNFQTDQGLRVDGEPTTEVLALLRAGIAGTDRPFRGKNGKAPLTGGSDDRAPPDLGSPSGSNWQVGFAPDSGEKAVAAERSVGRDETPELPGTTNYLGDQDEHLRQAGEEGKEGNLESSLRPKGAGGVEGGEDATRARHANGKPKQADGETPPTVAVVQENDPSTQRQSTSIAGGAMVRASPPTGHTQELNYANLLKLYIAKHRDRLDNDAFAWQYFKVFKAPRANTPECAELQRQARNPITLPDLVARERRSLPAELAVFANAPTTAVFAVDGSLNLDGRKYDREKQSFPVKDVYIPGDVLRQSGCPVSDAKGLSYAPRAQIRLELLGKEMIQTLPMDVARAKGLLDHPLASSAVGVTLPALVEIDVGEAPFVSTGSAYNIPARIIGVTVKDPKSGEVIHTYPARLFAAASKAAPSVETTQREAPPQLLDHQLVLMLLRDAPVPLTDEVIDEFTRQQITAERDFWRVIHSNVASARELAESDSAHGNLNMRRPLFAYEWQLLRDTRGELAEEVLKTFVRADSSWDFYRKEPEYDERLTAFVEASIFSRAAIGMDVAAPLTASSGEILKRKPDREAVYLVPQLAPVMAEHLRRATQALPRRVRLDFDMHAKYEVRQGKLLFGKDHSVDAEAPTVDPLTAVREPRLADDDTPVTSLIKPPLPRSAEGRILYQMPHQGKVPQEVRPTLGRGRTPADHWREMLRANTVGGVRTLALDRKVRFAPVEIAQARAEEVQRGTGWASGFPVTGRVVLDIERVDTVRTSYASSSGKKIQHRNGVLFAKVVAVEIIGPGGGLLASVDLDTLESGAEVAARAEQAEANEKAKQEAVKQTEATRIAEMRAALRNADVVGIRLGMTIAEAERVVRQRMDVGWVAELSGDALPKFLAQQWTNHPYSHFRTFIRADGVEQITLFWHTEVSERILAVTRSVRVPEGTSADAMRTQLIAKYGDQPVLSENSGMVWTADYGLQKLPKPKGAGSDWLFRSGSCQSKLRGAFDSRYLRTVTGENLYDTLRQQDGHIVNRIDSTTIIDVHGGKRPKPPGDSSGNTWDPSQWRECGSTVLATIGPGREGKILRVGVHDLAAYEPQYAEILEKAGKASKVDLDL